MPLTQDEVADLQAKVTAGTLDATDPLIAPLATLGLILRTPTQEEEFKTNYAKEVITKRDGDAYKVITDEFKSISKAEPLPNEKATDFVKRVFTGLQSERDTLKTKVDGGNGSDADKARIQKLEQDIVSLRDTHTKELENKTTELKSFKRETLVANSFEGIKGNLKKSLDAALLPDIQEGRMARFNREFEIDFDESGKERVLYKTGPDAGQPVKDSNFKELSVADVMKTKVFNDLIETRPNQPGSGAPAPGTPPTPQGAKPTKDTYQRPTEVTTRVKLHNDLTARGLTTSDETYLDIMDANASLPLGSDE